MKKSILILTAIFFSLTSVFAQNLKNDIELLKKELNISDVQAARISIVIEENNIIVAKTQKAFEGNNSVLQSRMEKLHELKINNVKGALTANQQELFDQKKLGDKL